MNMVLGEGDYKPSKADREYLRKINAKIKAKIDAIGLSGCTITPPDWVSKGNSKMTTVLTTTDARKILKGRLPHMPVDYEEGVKALQRCIDLDEAKLWDNKADALAAWAKIYRSDEAGRKSKQLKLHAYRRMGELSRQLRPGGFRKGRIGMMPGAGSLLVEQGLSQHQADVARVLARANPKKFENLLNRPNVPSVSRASLLLSSPHCSDSWVKFATAAGSATPFRSYCRAHPARELAFGMTLGEAAKARLVVVEIQEWLDEFEQHLPKA